MIWCTRIFKSILGTRPEHLLLLLHNAATVKVKSPDKHVNENPWNGQNTAVKRNELQYMSVETPDAFLRTQMVVKTYLIDQPAAPAPWRTGGLYCESTLRRAAGGPAWGWWRQRCWWAPTPPAAGGAGCWSEPDRWSPPCSLGWLTRSGRALSSRSPTRRGPGRWSATETCSSPGRESRRVFKLGLCQGSGLSLWLNLLN